MAAAAGDGDVVWEEDDPDFQLALSLYMDDLESKERTGKRVNEQALVHVNSEDDNDDETWSEDDPDFAMALNMYLDQVECVNKDSAEPGASPSEKADYISMTGCVVDQELEILDPNPDIWQLFRLFDDRFFGGRLKKNGVMLGWSPRMTSCAGLCAWSSRSQFCEIKLSQPLLMLRPRSDLVETLIHEMIHAILFVTRTDDNHESHGQQFHMHMFRINKAATCNITVFHNFHNEVRFYQKHVWKCNGPCKNKGPYYGIVRRAMNRAPGPKDFWYPKHQATCGGTFVKIEGPDPVIKTKKTDSKQASIQSPVKRPPKGVPDIRNFFPKSPEKRPPSIMSAAGSSGGPSFKPFTGTGYMLGSTASRSTATKSSVVAASHLKPDHGPSSTKIEVIPDSVPIELIELD